MNARQGRDAVWPPTERLQVGQVLRVTGSRPVQWTTLNDLLTGAGLGAAPAVVSGGVAADLDDSSGVSVALTASASAAGVASVQVTMSRSSSWLMRSALSGTELFEDMGAVERAVRLLHRRDEWSSDFVLVTEVQVAQALTVLLADEKETVLDVTATVPPGVAPSLDQVQAGAAVTVRKGSCSKYVTGDECTPCFRGHVFRRPVWKAGVGARRLAPGRRMADADGGGFVWTPADPLPVPGGI